MSEHTSKSKVVSISYTVVDREEWLKTNPLHYEHHGLKVITVGTGDAFERLASAEDLLNDLLDYPLMNADYEARIQAWLNGPVTDHPQLPLTTA